MQWAEEEGQDFECESRVVFWRLFLKEDNTLTQYQASGSLARTLASNVPSHVTYHGTKRRSQLFMPPSYRPTKGFATHLPRKETRLEADSSDARPDA